MPIKGTFLPFYKGGGLGCLAFVGWACLLAEAAWFLIHPSSWEIPFSIARCSIAQLLTTWVTHACYWMWGPLTIWTRPPRERFLNIQSKHEFKVKRVMNLRCFWLCWTVCLIPSFITALIPNSQQAVHTTRAIPLPSAAYPAGTLRLLYFMNYGDFTVPLSSALRET